MILPKLLALLSILMVSRADENPYDCATWSRCPYFNGYTEFRRGDLIWCSKPYAFPAGSKPVTLEMAQQLCDHNFVELSTLGTREEYDYYYRFAQRYGTTATWLKVKHNTTTGLYEQDDYGHTFDPIITPQPNVTPGTWPAFVFGNDNDLSPSGYGQFEAVNVNGTGPRVNMVICGYPGFNWN